MKRYIDVNPMLQPLEKAVIDEIALFFKRSSTEESEKTLEESWYAYENRLFSYVERGDVEGLLAFSISGLLPPRVGYNAHDELLQARYFAVSTLTLAARAAIRGGFGENDAFRLSDAYIQKSAELKDPDEVLRLVTAAVLDYTQRVEKVKTTPRFSPAVAFCCNYITEHIHINVSLAELAKARRLSGEHLSRLFKKETGYTLKKYAFARKMEAAAYLLTYSEWSIQDIAMFLGFSSHGRFSGYFKMQFGKTPREYRG